MIPSRLLPMLPAGMPELTFAGVEDITGPWRVAAACTYAAGAVAREAYVAGAVARGTFVAGAKASQAHG
jgi:hypothetical protein